MILLLILACCVAFIAADLPVHCLHKETQGEWTFYLSDTMFDKEAGGLIEDGSSFEICGHHAPDIASDMTDEKVSIKHHPSFESKKEIDVDLQDPNKAIVDGKKGGYWSMVYNQGMEVRMDGRRYLSNFRYVPKSSTSDFKKVEDYESICGETYSGMYINGDGSGGCFIGEKKDKTSKFGKVNIESDEYVLEPDEEKKKKKKSKHLDTESSFARQSNQLRSTHSNNMFSYDNVNDESMYEQEDAGPISTIVRVLKEDHSPFVPDVEFIELQNSDSNRLWNAKEYPDMRMKSVSEMKKKIGQKHHAVHTQHDKAHIVGGIETTDCMSFDLSGYPKDLNWATVNDGEFATPINSQGECGSCYGMAALDAFNMRVRIYSEGEDATIYSINNAVSCSPYNQGCDGGYPILVYAHGKDFGFVSTDCDDSSVDDIGVCHAACYDKESSLLSIEDYNYVGGYYGACDEKKMIAALQYGPMPVAFEAPSTLSYYDDGIFDGTLAANEKDIDGYSRWEKTNHAVVLVGYGEEEVNGKTIKFWVLKNSWGETFGLDGFFKMKRGCDALAMESMAVDFTIKDMPRKKYQDVKKQ